MTTKVFISYTNKDKGLAETAKKSLTEGGYLPEDSVFFDAHDIDPGDDIRAVLKKEVTEAAKVVLVMSPEATESGWVNYEVGLADALDKETIVVKQKDVRPPNLPDNLLRHQLLDVELDADLTLDDIG